MAQQYIAIVPEKDSVLIGDHIRLTIEMSVDRPEDIKSVDFSSWRKLDNNVYTLDTVMLEPSTQPTIIGSNEWGITDGYYSTPAGSMEGWQLSGDTIRKDIIISIYDMGVYLIPAPVIQNRSGNRYPMGKPINLIVLDPNYKSPDQELQPIKPIIEEGVSWEDFKMWFYILALVLVAPFLMKWLFRKKNHEEEEVLEEVVIPAHIKALEALHDLRERQLWQQGEVKQYQSSLTDIMRQYIEDRYEIQALEMTTDEISRALRKENIDEPLTSSFERILQIADLVKFAKAQPPIDINEQFMDEAIDWIEQTKSLTIDPQDVYE